MFLRPISILRAPWRIHHLSLQHYATNPIPRPFPTIPQCPSPTCAFAPTPPMPEGLKIDHSKNLNGTMAPYAEQVLICTGRNDWSSRIEEENGGDNLAADIRELIGRGGVYADPYNPISLLNASFPPSIPERKEIQSTSAYLFPSFKYIPFLPRISFDAVHALVRGYLQPRILHPAHEGLSPLHKDRLSRSESERAKLWGVRDVESVVIAVCGHGGRDGRCGVMGPVLKGEFERLLPLLEGERFLGGGDNTTRVGLVSHVGGHKFAGNVVVYIPPGYTRVVDGVERTHELAGMGVWYGRVEPRHVEGILRETVGGGRVIGELFRGGIKQGGEILRL